ncbi:MAG: flagellar hook-length control protein FliK [Pseudomonadota bacterium]
MSTTTPFLLATSSLADTSLTPVNKGQNRSLLLTTGDQSDVDTVVEQVLGFATELLEASEQLGKSLPVSGKTLPLDTALEADSEADSETVLPVAVPLPLVDELETLRLKPTTDAPVLPIRDASANSAPPTPTDSELEIDLPVAQALNQKDTPPTFTQSATLASLTEPQRLAPLGIEPRESLVKTAAPSRSAALNTIESQAVPRESIKVPGQATRVPAPPLTSLTQPVTEPPPTVPSEQTTQLTQLSDRFESLRVAVETDSTFRVDPTNRAVVRGASLQTLLPLAQFDVATPTGFVAPTVGGATPALPTLSLSTPIVAADGTLEPQWGQEFAERVGWVVNAKVPKAQLRLHPESLGPIELTIEADDQLARVQFAAAHPLTREAIEQSLPKLRAMLEQHGLSLDQADISGFDRSQQDESAASETLSTAESNAIDETASAETSVEVGLSYPLRRGLIDTYV